MTAKRKLGRPPKYPEQRRTELLRIMLTPGERAALARVAAAKRLDVSTYVRLALAPALGAQP